MDSHDPEIVARLYVMQWMDENGHHDALRALEKQLGRRYDDTSLPEASQLMQLIWRHVEEKLLRQDEDEQEGPSRDHQGAATTGTGGNSSCSRAARRRHQEEALQLLRAGRGDFAARVVVSEVPSEVHRSNIISVRIVPEQDCVITAAGDGCVRCVSFGPGGGSAVGGTAAAAASAAADSAMWKAAAGCRPSGSPEVRWETRVGSAALLSLALHPSYSPELPLVAVGGMDGRVTVLHGTSGAVLATAQVHTKYVLRVAWGGTGAATAGPAAAAPAAAAMGATAEVEPDPLGAEVSDNGSTATAGAEAEGGAPCRARGMLLVTASTDETVAVHMLDLDLDLDMGQGGGAAPGTEAARLGRLTTVKQIPYGAAITDAAFLRDGRMLAVAIRGSNYLRLLDVREALRQAAEVGSGAAAAGGGAVPERLVNLNELADDHVSFTTKQLLPSPCGRYLLVCTDTPRLLVLRTSDWSHLRHIFGLPVDQFLQPAAAWHRDSNYLYVSGAGAQLCVFHLGSGRLVHCSTHHGINVRDVDYDPRRNLLATCSFDKTVKLMGAGAAAPATGPAANAAGTM